MWSQVRQSKSLACGSVIGVALALTLAGCSSQDEPTPPPGTAQAPLSLGEVTTVAWGHGPDALRLQPRGYEQVATGPSAVAVAGGRVLVLDRLAGRVVEVGERVSTVAAVAADAEELVTGPHGAFAVWSPTRARVWVFSASGAPLGEVAVPRALREVVTIELGASHVVHAVTAYQERLTLGSPQAPMTLGATLRTKQEGALALDDGRGVLARVEDGQASLWLLTPGDERSDVVARIPFAQGVTAARIVGRTGSTVCARLETARTTEARTVEVTRRLACVDAATGKVVLDEGLPAVGTYLPRRELAVGAEGVTFIHPTDEGLALHHIAFEEGSP